MLQRVTRTAKSAIPMERGCVIPDNATVDTLSAARRKSVSVSVHSISVNSHKQTNITNGLCNTSSRLAYYSQPFIKTCCLCLVCPLFPACPAHCAQCTVSATGVAECDTNQCDAGYGLKKADKTCTSELRRYFNGTSCASFVDHNM